jgi:hypothetical protein
VEVIVAVVVGVVVVSVVVVVVVGVVVVVVVGDSGAATHQIGAKAAR